MRTILVILALVLFALPTLISAKYVHLVLAIYAITKTGLPTLHTFIAFLAGLALAPLHYLLAIIITNLGLPRLELRTEKCLTIQNIFNIFIGSLLEELSWRVTILDTVSSWPWETGTSLYFVFLHFRQDTQIVIMEWVEMMLFTGLLVCLVRIFGTPWIGIGLHFGRNVAATIVQTSGFTVATPTVYATTVVEYIK